MAQPKCVVCVDPRRADIEKGLEEPRSDCRVSRQFGISRFTLARHRAHILPKVLVDAQESSNNADIARNKAAAQHIADTSRDEKVRLAAMGRVQSLVELETRLALEATSAQSLPGDPAFQAIAAWLASHLCPKCWEALEETHDAVRHVVGGAVVEPVGGTRSESEEGGPGEPPPPPDPVLG